MIKKTVTFRSTEPDKFFYVPFFPQNTRNKMKISSPLRGRVQIIQHNQQQQYGKFLLYIAQKSENHFYEPLWQARNTM